MEARPDVRREPWVRAAQGVLWFCGASYLLMGIGCLPLFLLMPLLPDSGGEAPPLVLMIPLALFAFAISAGVALVNFAAAIGLGRGARWAWVVTVILGATYAPSACLPFGAVLLYAMLNDRNRRQFLN